MRSTRSAVLAVAATLVVVALTACGGGGAGDPTATVKDLVGLVGAKQFDRMADLACAAEKTAVAQRFDFGSAMAGGLGGADAKAVTDALTVTLADPAYTEVERSGDTAKVHLTATLKVGFDRDRMGAILRDALKAQGLTVVDAQVNSTLDTLAASFAQGQPVDSTIDLVVENGRWVICGMTDATS